MEKTLLITKLTIKSDLQFISLTNKQLFSQSTIYNSFRLKKRNLISIFIVVIFFGLTYYTTAWEISAIWLAWCSSTYFSLIWIIPTCENYKTFAGSSIKKW